MPNQKRNRKITMPPPMEGFKPFGIPMRNLHSVNLLFEEFEALRLSDYENLRHEEAASRMNVSRPTYTRIYDRARKVIAEAFVEGKAIIIEGGTYVADNYWYRCGDCHQTTVAPDPIDSCTECESENITRINPQAD